MYIKMKIFCKSFPPRLGGDGILVQKYLKYGKRDAQVYTVGEGESPENVTYLSNGYGRSYRKQIKKISKDNEFIWAHSTRLGFDLNKNLKEDDFLTVHGLWGLVPRKPDVWWKYYRNKLAEYLYFKFLSNSQVTVVSHFSKNKLAEYINPYHIPNGVDFSGFEETEKKKKAVFLGRHHPQKDLEFVTEISKFLIQKGYKVHIGGNTTKFSLDREWNKIDGLTYGYLSEEDKSTWLKESKYLIQPSKWEGFPTTAIMEALKYKCIPIIRDYSNKGITDLSEFFIFTEKDNFKEKINNYRYSEINFKKLSKLLEGKYNWENIIKEYDRLFDKFNQ
ncbi:Glycosyltransferase, AglL family [Methanonatronarchaeum thermophilum]|uniref:Glycosyltransferase, AglL family n=1 Tax=Methanonatronarchaeum thermophilum TaxID=1927129 RepID=A0A1Y3GCW2_9EURY|nr:glycosyltransferase family 4 protein [Methanonatronarchaeum thermophilum]OUJ19302.1 Glycosyltransferase, AglL family [Methanonatronarchaeum thermophilum]